MVLHLRSKPTPDGDAYILHCGSSLEWLVMHVIQSDDGILFVVDGETRHISAVEFMGQSSPHSAILCMSNLITKWTLLLY